MLIFGKVYIKESAFGILFYVTHSTPNNKCSCDIYLNTINKVLITRMQGFRGHVRNNMKEYFFSDSDTEQTESCT